MDLTKKEYKSDLTLVQFFNQHTKDTMEEMKLIDMMDDVLRRTVHDHDNQGLTGRGTKSDGWIRCTITHK